MENTPTLFNGSKIAPVVQKYDRKFNLVFSKEINVDDTDIKFGNMIYAKDKFLFCTQSRDSKDKRVTCAITKMDMNGKLAKPVKAAIIQYKDRDDEPNYIKWQISEDTSKILLATLADDNDDDLMAKTSVTVMDNDANKIWSRGVTLPYSQEQLTLKSWTLANNGTFNCPRL